MSDFTIDVGSDQEHDDLIAEILFKGQVVAVISQERGPGMLDIRLIVTSSEDAPGFPLQDFEQAVENARKRLLELKKDRAPRRK